MHCRQSVIAYPQAARLADPTERAFHHPAHFAQPAAVRYPRGRQVIFNPSVAQAVAVPRGPIRSIAIELVGLASGTPPRPMQHGNLIERGQRRERIMPLGPGEGKSQGSTVAIDDQMPFRAFFRAIRGIFACQRPPKTARIEALSMLALSQSSLSSRLKRSRSACSNFFHTPRRCHARIRRQQVTPEPHPISWGSISQGMPLLRTKTIPVKQARSSTGRRPRLPGRALWRGSNGLTISQSSSGTKGSAIALFRHAEIYYT
jgi:hypothetical protein